MAESSSSSSLKSDAEVEEMLDLMLTRLVLCDDSKLEPLLSKLLPLCISSLPSQSLAVLNKDKISLKTSEGHNKIIKNKKKKRKKKQAQLKRAEMAEKEPNPKDPVSEKDVKSPNIFERAKEEIEAMFHHDKSPHHHKETHGTSDDIDEGTSPDEVKAPNVFERVKEEIEAVVGAIHPKKASESGTRDLSPKSDA